MFLFLNVTRLSKLYSIYHRVVRILLAEVLSLVISTSDEALTLAHVLIYFVLSLSSGSGLRARFQFQIQNIDWEKKTG